MMEEEIVLPVNCSSTLVGSSQIKLWSAFLSNGNNKAELIPFMVSRWERHILIIGDSKLYIAFDEQCICIRADGSSEVISGQIIHASETDVLLSPSPYLLNFHVTCVFALACPHHILRKSKTILDPSLRLTDIELFSKWLVSFYALSMHIHVTL